MRRLVILVLLVCVAYANSLYAPFVFDDIVSVQGNQIVQFFSFHFRDLLFTRSLLILTYAFNQWLGGQNVLGYHVVNLFLHIINGLLVFAIARRIYQRLDSLYDLSMYALLAAAFFLLHPLQTESVTYISQRSEPLSKLVYLCGLLFFTYIPDSKIGFFASIPILFCVGLGLGFKENVVTLPVVIVLYDYIFLAKSNVRNMLSRWRFYFGMVVLTGTGAYIFRDALRRPLDVVGVPGTLPHWNYFLTELPVTIRYLGLIVFPVGQNLDYEIPPATSIYQPQVLLSILLIVGLIIIAWRWRRTKPVYAFSIFWFLIALLPYGGVISLPDVMVEHRLYLPLIGVCFSFPLVVEWLWGWLKRVRKLDSPPPRGGEAPSAGVVSSELTRTYARPTYQYFAWLILFALLTATIMRNYVWADETRLFADVVAKSPHKVRAYENLVYAHMQRGQEEQAISVAKLGIANVPDRRVIFFDTIGNLDLRLDRPAEAVEYFRQSNEESVRIGAADALLAKSFNNLGVAYLTLANSAGMRNGEIRTNALRSARDAFRRSTELDPNDLGVANSLVTVNYQLGEVVRFEHELREQPPKSVLSNLFMLATSLSLQDRYPEAIEYFRNIEELEHGNAFLYFNYAFALSKTGQLDLAIAEYLNALRIQPIFAEARYNLAILYLQKADYASALQHLTAIVAVESANVRANIKLAQIYTFQGKLPLARQHLQQVLKTAPQDREALSLFAQIGR